jgi:hypothetical protein
LALALAWFQNAISEPIEQFVGAAIANLDRDGLAEDFAL